MSTNFKPTIKLPQAIALYIGAVLGSGILIVPGIAAEIAGPASLIVWGMMLVLVLPLALCMGFLAQKYPDAGGVSHFVTKAFGVKIGSLVGWFFLMSVPIGAPVASLTGARYLSSALGMGENVTIIIAIFMIVAALTINLFGMRLAGKIQVAVVAGILLVLVLGIIGSIPNIKFSNFTPFMPNGIASMGRASTILFWCFIGWEAISHLSEEFVNPQKDVIRATIISAIIVGIIYFMTAFATIGTRSYGEGLQAPIVNVIRSIFGTGGAIAVGVISMLICTAAVIAYIGAASRLAFSLSKNGEAPKALGYVSNKFKTPVGGLVFLFLCFILVFSLYSLKLVNITTLLKLPNATFLITYLAGCAAGVVLLKNEKKKLVISVISLVSTIFIFVFVGWAILYPLLIVFIFVISKTLKFRCQGDVSGGRGC